MKIIAAVDLSKATSYIVEAVHRVASATDAEVILVFVEEPLPTVPGPDLSPVGAYDSLTGDGIAEPVQLTEQVEQLRELGIVASAQVLQGDPARTVVEVAKQRDAELIVIGSHGHGVLFEALVGSVSAKILRHSPLPVLVVPIRGLD
jgi:nucleotide-binding universal stress UspA family protein